MAAQIGREGSDDAATRLRDRLGALEVDDALVDVEAGDIGLDRRRADALLARRGSRGGSCTSATRSTPERRLLAGQAMRTGG